MILLCTLLFAKGVASGEAHYSHVPDNVVLKRFNSRPLISQHNLAVIRLALEKTRDTWGPYTLKDDAKGRSTSRIFKELNDARGERLINTHVSVTSKKRESLAHAIKIPVRMGLLNYRLIVTKTENLPIFKDIETLEDLKPIPVGSVAHWTTTEILRENSFNVVAGLRSEGIYKMLEVDRYQYLLRGVSEVFHEGEVGKHADFSIEPTLLLFIPLPYYVFVAPDEHRLIARLEEGLEAAVADGSFEDTLLEYYGNYIQHANLRSRKVLYIRNPELVGSPSLLRPELWYIDNPGFSEHLRDNYAP